MRAVSRALRKLDSETIVCPFDENRNDRIRRWSQRRFEESRNETFLLVAEEAADGVFRIRFKDCAVSQNNPLRPPGPYLFERGFAFRQPMAALRERENGAP